MALYIETVDYLALPPAEQAALTDEMLSLDRALFSGARPEDLLPYLQDPAALAIPVVLYRDGRRLVGQNIIPVTRLALNGRPAAVMNSIAGLLPAYRGADRMHLAACWVGARFVLSHLFWRRYIATTLLQPRVYEQFLQRSPYFYPRPDKPTPPAIREVMAAIAASGAGYSERAAGVFVQHNQPPPHTTDRERSRIQPARPYQRFFLEHAPDHASGTGILCVCRLSLWTLLPIAVRAIRARARRWL